MSRHAFACAFLLLGAQCGGEPPATTSLLQPTEPAVLPWEGLRPADGILAQPVPAAASSVFTDLPSLLSISGRDVGPEGADRPGPTSQAIRPLLPAVGLAVKSTEFAVGAIPRAAFAAASDDALPAPWERSREATRRAQEADFYGDGGHPWSDLSIRSAAQRTSYRGDQVAFDATHSLELSRVLPRARLALKARLTDQAGRRFLEEGSLRLETFGGWRGDLGGIAFSDGGPLLSAARGRGVSLERDLDPVGRHGVIHTRLAWGRSAVRHENIRAGRYPRSIVAGTVHLHAPEGIEVGLDALRLSDPTRESTQTMAVRQAWSTGVEAVRAGKSTSLELEAATSGLSEQGRGEQRSSRVMVSTRAEKGPVSVGGSAASAQGHAFRVGPLGAIEPVPAQVLAADVTVRPGRGSFVGAWAGQWKHARPWGEGTPVLDANLANRASEGNQIGGRIGTSWTRTRSGVSLSMEYRRRALADQNQRIRTTGASISQGLGKTAQLSLQANRFVQEGAQARDYASGNLSVRIWDRATLALEQQTVWQEPYGAQVLSFVEIAASPFGSKLLPMSLRVSQSHEQNAGSFRPRQSQASISGGVRLSREATLSLRLQSTMGRSQRSEAIEVGLRHAFDSGTPTGSVPSGAAREADRQLLGGVVFEDRNGDGVRSPGEEGIAGVEVVIDNDVRTPVRTDLDGRYRTLLTPGRHLLRLLPESIPTCYSLDGTGAVEIEVTADRFAEHDFALERRTGSIRGRLVFGGTGPVDPLTAAESQRVEGLRVLLDDREYTVTDAEGEFVFHALPAGPHEVSIDPASLPPGVRIEGEPRCVVMVGMEGRSEVDCTFVLIRPVVRRRF